MVVLPHREHKKWLLVDLQLPNVFISLEHYNSKVSKLPKTTIVVVGMPGAGKSDVSKFFKERGIPMFRTGDVFREEVVNRGMELNIENSEKISRQMREELGMDVAARIVMDKILKLPDKLACIEGPRDMYELAYIAKLSRLILVVVRADSDTRFQRLKNRKQGSRDPRSMQEFRWRDEKERERGLAEVLDTRKYARYVIENDGTLEELREKAKAIFDEIRSNMR